MKFKMWCLVNKKTDRIISIGNDYNEFAVGFATKKDLLSAIGNHVDYDEEIRKIEIELK